MTYRLMASRVLFVALPWTAVLIAACGGDGAGMPADGGAGDGDMDAGLSVRAPAPPSLTPCPEGWNTTGSDPTICDPWPEAGPGACGADEGHFPGEEACVPIGSPCGEGPFSGELPEDTRILYVHSLAAPGGGGERDAPFQRVTDALGAATRGTVVALADETYDEAIRIPEGVTLWGACVSRTHLASSRAGTRHQATITVAAPDVVVRNLSVSGARVGLAVQGRAASAHLEDLVVDGATSSGILVGPDARATGRSVVVRNTETGADGISGYGLAVGPGSEVTLRRVSLEANRVSGVSALDASVTLTDVAIRATRPTALHHDRGMAAEALGGAQLVLRRAAIEGNRDRAIMAREPDTHLTVEDSVVRDTLARDSDSRQGRAFVGFEGAELTLRRVTVDRSRDVAILLAGHGTTATLEDTVVRNTQPERSSDLGGTGLALQGEATATASRALFENNVGVSVSVSSGSRLTMNDVSIRDTASTPDGTQGTGLNVQLGSIVNGSRVRLLRNRQSGLSVLQEGSRLALTDVVVEDTLERECAATDCPDLGFGDGVIAAVYGQLALDRFEIIRSARVGVHVAGGTADLHRGVVRDNPIGAAIQTPGFDASRISDGVLYTDNGRNLDMGNLPLPEPSIEFE